MEVSYLTSAEIRRANLATLVGQAGSQRTLADATELAPAQISQWATAAPNSRTKKPRNISDESARLLEAKMSKPVGWMDHDHSRGPILATPPAPTLTQALETLGIALATDMSPDVRQDAADLLAKLAQRHGAERHQAELLQLLQAAPSKRTGTGR